MQSFGCVLVILLAKKCIYPNLYKKVKLNILIQTYPKVKDLTF